MITTKASEDYTYVRPSPSILPALWPYRETKLPTSRSLWPYQETKLPTSRSRDHRNYEDISPHRGNNPSRWYINTRKIYELIIIKPIYTVCGTGSSVGIATDYGLEVPESNPGGDEIFRPSKPVLGPTQPPVKWVPLLSRG